MTNTDLIIRRISEHGEEIRLEYGVARVGVFGSRVRGEARPDSDLDVRVDLVSAAALKPLLNEHCGRGLCRL